VPGPPRVPAVRPRRALLYFMAFQITLASRLLGHAGMPGRCLAGARVNSSGIAKQPPAIRPSQKAPNQFANILARLGGWSTTRDRIMMSVPIGAVEIDSKEDSRLRKQQGTKGARKARQGKVKSRAETKGLARAVRADMKAERVRFGRTGRRPGE
jgi:hypothetical protein